jgi:hypothetical protein
LAAVALLEQQAVLGWAAMVATVFLAALLPLVVVVVAATQTLFRTAGLAVQVAALVPLVHLAPAALLPLPDKATQAETTAIVPRLLVPAVVAVQMLQVYQGLAALAVTGVRAFHLR